MRHNKDDKRFSRNTGHLRSMMSNLTRDLLMHERIKTTTPKSKELRRSAEKMITLGKLGTLSARRRAMAFLHDKALVTKLFTELGTRFKDRKGGYTRSIKAGVRHGDCAPLSLIELVDRAPEKADTKPVKGTKAAAEKKEKAKGAVKKAAPKKAAPTKKEKGKETVVDKAKAAAKKAVTPKKEKAKETVKSTAKKAEAPKKDTAKDTAKGKDKGKDK